MLQAFDEPKRIQEVDLRKHQKLGRTVMPTRSSRLNGIADTSSKHEVKLRNQRTCEVDMQSTGLNSKSIQNNLKTTQT